MNLGQMLLSPSGRVSRRGYWIYAVILNAVYAVLYFLTYEKMEHILDWDIPHFVVTLVFLWPSIAMGIKRSHDRGRGWWFVILTFVPVVNLWPIIEFLVLRGTQGDNEYGPDPATETRSTWWIWIVGILSFAASGYLFDQIGTDGMVESVTGSASISEQSDTTSDSMDEAAGAAGEAASGAADAAADAAESASDTAGDAADTATDAAGDAMDQASDAASSAADAASDAASSAADTASDAMDEAQDKASDTASDAKSKMNDAMGAN